MDTPKYLYFDVDKSTASIGGHRGVEALFGFRPVKVNHGVDQANALLSEVTKSESVGEDHPIFSRTSAERKTVFNDAGQEIGADGLIIDTLSLMFRQQKKMVVGERNKEMKSGSLKAMDKRGWGLIRDDIDDFMGKLSNCEFPVIVNCHSKSDENEIGRSVLKPEIQGSAQEAMLAYPDLVAYCVTGSSAPDGHEYGWYVGKDIQHEDTKSRAHGLPDSIPQDFQLLLDAFQKVDTPNPFFLILGKAGQGKTSALRTLNPNHEEISRELGLVDFLDESGDDATTDAAESADTGGDGAVSDTSDVFG